MERRAAREMSVDEFDAYHKVHTRYAEMARTADEAGMTLIALVRGADFEIFTHPDRIQSGAIADVA